MFGIKSMTLFPALNGGGGHVRAGYKVVVFPALKLFSPLLKQILNVLLRMGEQPRDNLRKIKLVFVK